MIAHGDAREGKWSGNWRMECVASTLHTTSEHGVSSITTADAHRLPVFDWTDAPADLNGLVRFAERRILVSARVPSHFKRSLHPKVGWRERNKHDATNPMFIIKLLSQHISGILMPIIRRTRPCTITYDVLHGLCWLWLAVVVWSYSRTVKRFRFVYSTWAGIA